VEKLKSARNLLLKLHKIFVDVERNRYEANRGPVSSGEFLGLLLDDPDFAWLRKFSALIVEIDEMFAQREGYSDESVERHITAMSALVTMKDEDEQFRTKYEFAMQNVLEAGGIQGELKSLLT